MSKKGQKKESVMVKLRLSADSVLRTMTSILSAPLKDRETGWFKAMIALDDNLVDYLRDPNNETPNWDEYPLARSWFSQNGVRLKADE